MKKITLLCMIGLGFYCYGKAQHLRPYVLNAGGIAPPMSQGTYSLHSSLGELAITTIRESPPYALTQGYLQTEQFFATSIENDLELQDAVRLFPNPFDEELHLEGLEGKNVYIRIWDTHGKIVYERPFTTRKLKLDSLIPAIYTLTIHAEDNRISALYRIIKK